MPPKLWPEVWELGIPVLPGLTPGVRDSPGNNSTTPSRGPGRKGVTVAEPWAALA